MTSLYQAVIFDAGGTLIGQDDPLGFERQLAAAFADLGASATAEEIHSLMPKLRKEARKRRERIGGWSRTADEEKRSVLWVASFLLENLGVLEDVEAKAAAIFERFAAGEFINLFSDVEPTLESLERRGITMGVLSNYAPFLERNLGLLGIHHYFAFFVVSSLVGFEKPDPRIFRLAMKKTGYPPKEILYVGDSIADDVEGAQRVGLGVILLDRFDRFPEAHCERIASLAELIQLFS